MLHYSENTSGSSFRPNEAAFLGFPSARFPNQPTVNTVEVLAAPSNFYRLKAMYEQIPGVVVRPFKLRPQELTVGIMLTLMSVDSSEKAPLYMSQVTKVLREMASASYGGFDYLVFRQQMRQQGLDRKQADFLDQRLDLLESFLDLEGSTPQPSFAAGTVTIVDLSCPFVDANTACVLFEISLNMYLQTDVRTGKVIAVDEAHKVQESIAVKDVYPLTSPVYDRYARRKGVDRFPGVHNPSATSLWGTSVNLYPRADHISPNHRFVFNDSHTSFLQS